MTTHWFYTFGSAPRRALYALPDGRYTAHHHFVLPALLHVGWPVADATNVRFHGFVTDALAQPIEHESSPLRGQTPRDVFRDALPTTTVGAVTSSWNDPAYNVDDRDLNRVLRIVLSAVEPGDVVLVELTNGLRHVTTGLLLSAGLLRALHPSVEVRGVTYADLASRPVPPELDTDLRRISEIHDLSPWLDLFAWAVAVDALGRTLDPGPLNRRLEHLNLAFHEARLDQRLSQASFDAVTRVRGALKAVAPALALGRPRDIAKAMSGARHAIADLEGGEASEALHALEAVTATHVLAEASRRLAGLTSLDADPEILNVERLRYDLDLVDRLRAAGRLGDALRILREWIVNAALLANGLATDWLDQDVRQTACANLWREQRAKTRLGLLWEQIAQFRNLASHAGMNPDDLRQKSVEARLQQVPAEFREWLGTTWDLTQFRWQTLSPTRRWLANAFSLNMLGPEVDTARLRILEIDLERARTLPWTSCIGHEDTAAVLSLLLEREVPLNRETIRLGDGDELVVAQLEGPRLPLGATKLPPDAVFRWFHVTYET